ncbi:hypothetical protein BH09BAC2_BH09BAC2_20480 [soil metagenome]
MKHILLFGAGKSSTCLIDYLVKESAENEWRFTVCDADLSAAKTKLGGAKNTDAVSLNVEDDSARKNLVRTADVVISLLPPHLHYFVAKDCIEFSKHLLTASYVDDKIKALENEIKSKGILFLCEMGLDPGIDHMSAVKLIHKIKEEGGKITSFISHCGGLVAPESDDNPWHYKISWNPRNIVMAGKAGAVYKLNDEHKEEKYDELFVPERVVRVDDLGLLSYYPNRDSSGYMDLYDLKATHTFIRTTLRYPEFCYGWKNIVDLHLTDETVQYNTDGMTLQDFFTQHFAKYKFSEWLTRNMAKRLNFSKDLLEKIFALSEAQDKIKNIAEVTGEDTSEFENFMLVDEKGDLRNVELDDVKNNAANAVMTKLHEANLSMKQLMFLGMDSEEMINKGMCSAADVLQFILEKKLALKEGDKDMIVMLHEIEYVLNDVKSIIRSSLIVKGEDHIRTAMAKTVGLPMGIAAKLILQNKINLSGLYIPVIPEIYEPVLKELEENGIKFRESESDS